MFSLEGKVALAGWSGVVACFILLDKSVRKRNARRIIAHFAYGPRPNVCASTRIHTHAWCVRVCVRVNLHVMRRNI